MVKNKKKTTKQKMSTGKKQMAPGMFTIGPDGNLEKMALSGFVNEGVLKNLRGNAIPSYLDENFLRAQKYRNENPYIQAIVDTIINFGLSGFHNSTRNSKVRKIYDKFCKKHDLDSRLITIWENLVTCSNTLLFYKLKDKKIEYIMTIDPALCKVVPLYGKKIVYVKPDGELQSVFESTNETEKMAVDNLINEDPTAKKLYEASKGQGDDDTKDYAHFKESDGEYVLLRNEKGLNDRLIPPRMQAIYYDISILEMLIDGDSQVAFYTKNVVLHVTGGETITSGQKAGSKAYMVDDADLSEMKNKFKNVSKALRIFTQNLWTMKYVFPDPKIWAPEKYRAVEDRIFIWSHVGKGLMKGEGGNYSIMYIKIKDLIAYIRKLRKIVSRLIEELYEAYASSREGKGFIKEGDIPKVRFDEQMLKEPRVLLEEIKTFLTQGILDSRTALEETDRHSAAILSRKKQDQEDPLLLTPIYEKGQGQSYLGLKLGATKNKGDKNIDENNGRPKTVDKTGDIPQPRPSTSNEPLHITLDMADKGFEDLVLSLAPISTLPKAAMALWEKVYLSARKAGDTEAVSARKAWEAVKKVYRKDQKSGKWVKIKNKK